jgi:hypothetical protein
MLAFYRPRKWMIPALADRKDLLFLEQMLRYQPEDQQSARKQNVLVFNFHQTNYMTSIGGFVGLFLAILSLWAFHDDIVPLTSDSLILLVLLLSTIAIIPFCYFLRILGMWHVRRNFQKLCEEA